ncbi:MAG TPA: hypothetical protein VD999_01585 [Vitreimonas sp.]|nr:hypothetical protein [Vitreimonas sp.]
MEDNTLQNLESESESQVPTISLVSAQTLKIAVVGLLLLLPIAAGGGYYLGKKSVLSTQVLESVSRPVVTNQANPSPSSQLIPHSEITAIQPTSTPGASATNWTQHQLAIKANTMGGLTNYTFGFKYPAGWNLEKIAGRHESDDPKQGCEDYALSSLAGTEVEIKMYCDGWTGTYLPIPPQTVTVTKLPEPADDSSDIYIVRYVDSTSGSYAYGRVLTDPGQSVDVKEQLSRDVTVKSNANEHYFKPVEITVRTSNESELPIVDEVVKSFTLRKQ